jgi:nucleoid-associated protein YgaU
MRTHQVAHGDNLSKIALQYLGHGGPEGVHEIYELNKDKPGVGGPPDYLLTEHEGHFPVLDLPDE